MQQTRSKSKDAEINENVAYIKEMKDQQQQDGI